MADRILGPVYPALLAPGLGVVLHDPGRDYDGLDAVVQAIADGPPGAIVSWVNPTDAGITIEWEGVAIDGLRIDYADPHTRDRVARALWAALGTAAEPTTAPQFWRWVGAGGGDPEWVMTSEDSAVEWTFRRRGKTAADVVVVPGLVGITTRTPNRDILALRTVAAAVWGPR